MGRTVTPKYAVEVTHGSMAIQSTPSAWNSKQNGRPTEKNLKAWVDAYNESLKPGGVNQHLTENWPIESARIIKAVILRNDGSREEIATWPPYETGMASTNMTLARATGKYPPKSASEAQSDNVSDALFSIIADEQDAEAARGLVRGEGVADHDPVTGRKTGAAETDYLKKQRALADRMEASRKADEHDAIRRRWAAEKLYKWVEALQEHLSEAQRENNSLMADLYLSILAGMQAADMRQGGTGLNPDGTLTITIDPIREVR
jgi:hypothetical protein